MYTNDHDPLDVPPPIVEILSSETNPSRQIRANVSSLFTAPRFLGIALDFHFHLFLSWVDITSNSS